MTEFDYKVASNDEGTTIELVRLSDGTVKVFTSAHKNVAEVTSRFMDSLMDDQCLQFFPDGTRKGKRSSK